MSSLQHNCRHGGGVAAAAGGGHAGHHEGGDQARGVQRERDGARGLPVRPPRAGRAAGPAVPVDRRHAGADRAARALLAGSPAACRLTEVPLPCTSMRRRRSAPPFDYGEACPSNTPPTAMPARRSRPGAPRTPLAGSPRRRRAQVALATAKTDKGAVTRAARKAEALLREMVAITLRQDLTRIQRISLETCITVHMHQKESSGTQPSPQSRAARSANPISILTLRTTAPSLVLLPAPSCSAMCRARSDSTALQLQRAGDAQRSW